MGVLRRVRRKDGEARTWEWRLVSFLSYLCMRRKTQQATYSLFSLAKFLELLIYSPSLSSLDPSLCSHTASSKHDIVRHFAHSGWTLAFETSEVRDVYEVKVPKVRMLRGGTRGFSPVSISESGGVVGRRLCAVSGEVSLASRYDSCEGNFVKCR